MSESKDTRHSNTTLRWNLIGLFLALLIAIGFVFVLETGELVEWLSRNRHTKVDEVIAVAILFLMCVSILFVRRWLGLSLRVSTSSDQESAPVVAQARHGVRRDLVGIGVALLIAVVLVFLFDTGWLVEWLAQHKSAKIDEIIVVSIVLLLGLSFFSVRRSIELTDHLQKYQELHERKIVVGRHSRELQKPAASADIFPVVVFSSNKAKRSDWMRLKNP